MEGYVNAKSSADERCIGDTRLVTCDGPNTSSRTAKLLSATTSTDDGPDDERNSNAYEDVMRLTFLAAGFLALVAVEEATFLAAGFLAAVWWRRDGKGTHVSFRSPTLVVPPHQR